MTEAIDQLLKQTQLAGVAATVLVDGEVVYEGAGGVRAAGEPTPMTVDAVSLSFR